jgi:hypothetical protein
MRIGKISELVEKFAQAVNSLMLEKQAVSYISQGRPFGEVDPIKFPKDPNISLLGGGENLFTLPSTEEGLNKYIEEKTALKEKFEKLLASSNEKESRSYDLIINVLDKLIEEATRELEAQFPSMN